MIATKIASRCWMAAKASLSKADGHRSRKSIRIHTVSYNFKSNKVSPLAFNTPYTHLVSFLPQYHHRSRIELIPPPTITGKLFPNEPFGWKAY